MTQIVLSWRAWAELSLLSLIWGASFLSIRIALDELPFLASVAWRVVPAALALWLYVLWRGIKLPRSRGVWGAFLVMGLLNNVLPFSLMAWGQLHIESGLTSILNAATAIFGVIFAAFFFTDERLTRHKALGVLLGFFGVATTIGLTQLLSFDPRSLAQLAVILGTISYALASIWARKTLAGLPPELAAAGMLTGAALIVVPVAIAVEGVHVPQAPQTWAAVGYYTFIATALAYLLYYRVLKIAGAGNLMLCTLMIPPIAILLGAAILGEALSAQAYLGFALLALGLILIDGRILKRRRN